MAPANQKYAVVMATGSAAPTMARSMLGQREDRGLWAKARTMVHAGYTAMGCQVSAASAPTSPAQNHRRWAVSRNERICRGTMGALGRGPEPAFLPKNS